MLPDMPFRQVRRPGGDDTELGCHGKYIRSATEG